MERRETIEVPEMRRQGLSVSWFNLVLIFGASAFIMGANVSEIVHRRYGPAKGGMIMGWMVVVIIAVQFTNLIVMHVKARREWKAMVAEYDATLEKIRASLIAENPHEIKNVDEFIADMRRKLPRP
jgi:hypothetical protein